jgi:PadR family transcriptional regulator AphA
MDVKTCCLGLLCFRDACGYDLKKEFERLFKHFYPAGCGSIYPALANLAEQGLISCQEVPQDGRPDRKVYRITEAGRKSFKAALANASPQHKLRSEFLAMVYFADLMCPDQLKRLLEERRLDLLDAVTNIAQIERSWGPDTPAGARFVAGFGSAMARTAADYIAANQNLLLDRQKASVPSDDTTSGKLSAKLEQRA